MKNVYFPHRISYLLLATLFFSLLMLPAKAQQRITGAKAADLQSELDYLKSVHNVKGISAAVYSPKMGTWKGVSGVSHGTVALDTITRFPPKQ